MSQPAASSDYRVRLDEFRGPLDLLLHLIRRSELDIADIPISEIADQYIAHVEGVAAKNVDVEVGGEFLVMAATLMEIKSRSLMPPEERAAAERQKKDEGDPRAELIKQLLAYRQFRDAADALEAKRQAFNLRWPASRIAVDKQSLKDAIAQTAETDLEDLDVMDLVESFARVAAAVNFDRLGEHKIQFEDTPIELHAADILERLDQLNSDTNSNNTNSNYTNSSGETFARMTFRELFTGATRGDIVGLFIATLELTRQRKILIEHDEESGMIMIRQREPEPDQDPGEETAGAAAEHDQKDTPDSAE